MGRWNYVYEVCEVCCIIAGVVAWWGFGDGVCKGCLAAFWPSAFGTARCRRTLENDGLSEAVAQNGIIVPSMFVEELHVLLAKAQRRRRTEIYDFISPNDASCFGN